jgi:hypothetical protein
VSLVRALVCIERVPPFRALAHWRVPPVGLLPWLAGALSARPVPSLASCRLDPKSCKANVIVGACETSVQIKCRFLFFVACVYSTHDLAGSKHVVSPACTRFITSRGFAWAWRALQAFAVNTLDGSVRLGCFLAKTSLAAPCWFAWPDLSGFLVGCDVVSRRPLAVFGPEAWCFGGLGIALNSRVWDAWATFGGRCGPVASDLARLAQ